MNDIPGSAYAMHAAYDARDQVQVLQTRVQALEQEVKTVQEAMIELRGRFNILADIYSRHQHYVSHNAAHTDPPRRA